MNAARGGAPAAAAGGARFAAGCVAAIAAVSAARALMAHPPAPWFDIDPAADPNAFPGLAPSASLAVDGAVLLLSACAAWALRRSIDRLGAALLVLAAVGTVPCLVHGLQDPDDAWRGMQWASALVAGAALAACIPAMPGGGARALRAVCLAVLVGAVAPLAARSALQAWVEHPAMVERFREHRAEILAAQGWQEGSPQALTYERRVLQAEATGWFGLANVASSLLAAGAVACLGAAVALRRALPAGALLAAALAAACTALVLVNGSKGAIAALSAGLAFAAWVGSGRGRPSWHPRVAVAAVAMVLVAVAARGIAGEASAERSLLFRAQYAQGAVAAFLASPVSGTGPAGFGDAYLALRPEASPEEVQSAHAAWADWLASLGIAGAAWIVLLAALVASSARPPGGEPPATAPGWLPGAAAAAALLAALAATGPELEALDGHSLLLRALGALLAAGVAGVAVRAAIAGPAAWHAAIAGAALLLAMHAQVEMTLWWPGSVAWVAAFLGAAAAGTARPGLRAAREGAVAAPVAAFLACAALAAASVPRARAAESTMREAALPLAAFARARAGERMPLVQPLDAARFAASRTLLADDGNPWRRRPAVVAAALEQAASSIAGIDPAATVAERERRCRLSLASGMLLLRDVPSERVAGACGTLAQALLAAPEGSVDRASARALLEDAARLQVEWNPRSVRGWSLLAEARGLAGDSDGARDAARRALEADASYRLDPLRQLGAPARAGLERLAGVTPGPAPSAPPR